MVRKIVNKIESGDCLTVDLARSVMRTIAVTTSDSSWLIEL